MLIKFARADTVCHRKPLPPAFEKEAAIGQAHEAGE